MNPPPKSKLPAFEQYAEAITLSLQSGKLASGENAHTALLLETATSLNEMKGDVKASPERLARMPQMPIVDILREAINETAKDLRQSRTKLDSLPSAQILHNAVSDHVQVIIGDLRNISDSEIGVKQESHRMEAVTAALQATDSERPSTNYMSKLRSAIMDAGRKSDMKISALESNAIMRNAIRHFLSVEENWEEFKREKPEPHVLYEQLLPYVGDQIIAREKQTSAAKRER